VKRKSKLKKINRFTLLITSKYRLEPSRDFRWP